jgi:hypothetical protein
MELTLTHPGDPPRHKRWSKVALVVATILVLGGAALVLSANAPSLSPPSIGIPQTGGLVCAGGLSKQCQIQQQHAQDQAALGLGQAEFPSDLAVDVDDTIDFTVTVRGTNDGSLVETPEPGGVISTNPVHVGGYIKVDATASSSSVGIQEISTASQPVFNETEVGNWQFRLAPTEPGHFVIGISFQVLEGDGNQILMQDPDASLTLTVNRTVGYIFKTIAQWIAIVGGFAGSVAAIGAIISKTFRDKMGAFLRRLWRKIKSRWTRRPTTS